MDYCVSGVTITAGQDTARFACEKACVDWAEPLADQDEPRAGSLSFLQHRHRDNRETRGLLSLSREEEEMNDTRARRLATSPLTLILAPGWPGQVSSTTQLNTTQRYYDPWKFLITWKLFQHSLMPL